MQNLAEFLANPTFNHYQCTNKLLISAYLKRRLALFNSASRRFKNADNHTEAAQPPKYGPKIAYSTGTLPHDVKTSRTRRSCVHLAGNDHYSDTS